MKAEGAVPQPRKVHVEEHFDDCGADYSSLIPYLDPEDSLSKPDQSEAALYQAIGPLHDFEHIRQSSYTYHADCLETVLNVLKPLKTKLDIV